MAYPLAVDIGSGVTKLAWYSDPTKKKVEVADFPTAAAEFPGGVADDIYDPDAYGLVSYNGTLWAVGDETGSLFRPNQRVNSLSGSWAGSPGWTAILYAAIARAFPDGGAFEVLLSTGLPQAVYGAHRKAILDHLNCKHQFMVGKREYEVTMQANVMPQALAALLHEATGNAEVMNYQSAVVDIGTYTTGYAVLHNGRLQNWRSNGIEVGVSALTQALARWLDDEKGLKVDPAIMPEVMRSRSVMFRDERLDLTEIIGQLATQVAKPIEEALIAAWDHGANDIARVFISGGGAPLFEPAITRIVPHARLSADPGYAVVRGLLTFLD